MSHKANHRERTRLAKVFELCDLSEKQNMIVESDTFEAI